jgi:hypothetical protein
MYNYYFLLVFTFIMDFGGVSFFGIKAFSEHSIRLTVKTVFINAHKLTKGLKFWMKNDYL